MSNNKLKENKQILNEYLILDDFIFIGLTALVIWAIKKIPGFKMVGKGSKSGLSQEVFDAVPYLYSDKEFVKDFVKILQKESNLEDIVAKAQSDWYKKFSKNKSSYRNINIDTDDYQTLIKGNIKGYGFQPDAKRIAEAVIKSNGYKKFSRKYKFTSADDRDMMTVIYYIVTRPDFAETAKKYLYTAANNDRNVTVPPLPKDAFNSFFQG
jgi:hypothetical protein